MTLFRWLFRFAFPLIFTLILKQKHFNENMNSNESNGSRLMLSVEKVKCNIFNKRQRRTGARLQRREAIELVPSLSSEGFGP